MATTEEENLRQKALDVSLSFYVILNELQEATLPGTRGILKMREVILKIADCEKNNHLVTLKSRCERTQFDAVKM